MARAQGSRCGLWSPADPAPFCSPASALRRLDGANSMRSQHQQHPVVNRMKRHTFSSSPAVSIPNHGRDQRETRSGLTQSRSRRGLGRGRIAAGDWTLGLQLKGQVVALGPLQTGWGLAGSGWQPMRARPATKTVSERQSPGTSAGPGVWAWTKALSPSPCHNGCESKLHAFCLGALQMLIPSRRFLPSRHR